MSLITRVMQFNTTVRYYFMTIRNAIVKNKTKQKTTRVGQDVEKWGLCTAGKTRRCSRCGKQCEGSSKN